MEGLRQNVAVREIEPLTEVEFPPSQGTGETQLQPSHGELLAHLQLLWDRRRWLGRVAAWGLVLSTVIAFLVPNQYESSVRIMPPDSMSNAGNMLAALAGGKGSANSELAVMAGSLLGMKQSDRKSVV